MRCTWRVLCAAPSLQELRDRVLQLSGQPPPKRHPPRGGTEVTKADDAAADFFKQLTAECTTEVVTPEVRRSRVLSARAEALGALASSTSDRPNAKEGARETGAAYEHCKKLVSVVRDPHVINLVTAATADSTQRRQLRVLSVHDWRLQLPPDEELEAECGIAGRLHAPSIRGVRRFANDITVAEASLLSRRAATITAVHHRVPHTKLAPNSWLWVTLQREGMSMAQAVRLIEQRTGIRSTSWRWMSELDGAACSTQWCVVDADDPSIAKLCDGNTRDGVTVQPQYLKPKKDNVDALETSSSSDMDAVHYQCLLRNVTATPAGITSALRKSLESMGFLNYYPPRRFGLGKVKLHHAHELSIKLQRVDSMVALVQCCIDSDVALRDAYVAYVRTGSSAVFTPWPWVRAVADLFEAGDTRDSAFRAVYRDLVPRSLRNAVATSIPHLVWNMGLSNLVARHGGGLPSDIVAGGQRMYPEGDAQYKAELHTGGWTSPFPLEAPAASAQQGTASSEAPPEPSWLPLIPWATKPNSSDLVSPEAMIAYNLSGFNKTAWSAFRSGRSVGDEFSSTSGASERSAMDAGAQRPILMKARHLAVAHFSETDAMNQPVNCRLRSDAELARELPNAEPRRRLIRERCPAASPDRHGPSRRSSSAVVVDIVLPKTVYLGTALRESIRFDRPELRMKVGRTKPALQPLNLLQLIEAEDSGTGSASPTDAMPALPQSIGVDELDNQLQQADRLPNLEPSAAPGNVMDFKVRGVPLRQAMMRGFVTDDASSGRAIPRDVRRPGGQQE